MIGVETGRIADLLTLFRILCAVVIVVVIAAQGPVPSFPAWVSDFLDGRIARGGGGSRLGRWDVIADGMVGALFIAGNLTAGMLLQLTGSSPALACLERASHPLMAPVRRDGSHRDLRLEEARPREHPELSAWDGRSFRGDEVVRVGPRGLEPRTSSLSGMRSNRAELWAPDW